MRWKRKMSVNESKRLKVSLQLSKTSTIPFSYLSLLSFYKLFINKVHFLFHIPIPSFLLDISNFFSDHITRHIFCFGSHSGWEWKWERWCRHNVSDYLFTNAHRWSKIAKHLPGRTDNEIKNFWRTRIQKQMKQSENLFQQQQGSSDQINDPQASTSQLSTISEPMEPYSSSSYQQLLEPFSAPQFPTTIPDNQNQTSTSSTNDNNNYWSMEDFWSMQLLNGD